MDQQKLQKVITFLESEDFEIKKLGLSFLGELYNIHSVLSSRFYQNNRWESFNDFINSDFLKNTFWNHIIGKAIYYSILNRTQDYLYDSIIVIDEPDEYDLKNAIQFKAIIDLSGNSKYMYYYPRIIFDYR